MAIPFVRLGKLLIFYAIFYAVLAAFCAAMFAVFLKTLDDNEPRWQGESSLIGNNPALVFRPRSHDALISYNADDNPENVKEWTKQLDELLKPYISLKKPETVQNCEYNSNLDNTKVCDFRISTNFGQCRQEYNYGFGNERGPCIFLKLNKIFGWSPDFYDESTIPKNMPEQLKKQVKNSDRGTVWVDCVPNNPSYVERIMYYPQQGFDGQYFPFTNVKGYLSPLVAVQFEMPARNVTIKIECRAWAANIHHDRKTSGGIARFSILIN